MKAVKNLDVSALALMNIWTWRRREIFKEPRATARMVIIQPKPNGSVLVAYEARRVRRRETCHLHKMVRQSPIRQMETTKVGYISVVRSRVSPEDSFYKPAHIATKFYFALWWTVMDFDEARFSLWLFYGLLLIITVVKKILREQIQLRQQKVKHYCGFLIQNLII